MQRTKFSRIIQKKETLQNQRILFHHYCYPYRSPSRVAPSFKSSSMNSRKNSGACGSIPSEIKLGLPRDYVMLSRFSGLCLVTKICTESFATRRGSSRSFILSLSVWRIRIHTSSLPLDPANMRGCLTFGTPKIRAVMTRLGSSPPLLERYYWFQI